MGLNCIVIITQGDKTETAINIGFSCKLLRKNMDLIVIKSHTDQDTVDQLLDALNKFWNPDGTPRIKADIALILDATFFQDLFEYEPSQLLLELGSRCKTVILCRLSAIQKALVVRLVKEGLVYNH